MSAWRSTVRSKATTGASASFSRDIRPRARATSADRPGTASASHFLDSVGVLYDSRTRIYRAGHRRPPQPVAISQPGVRQALLIQIRIPSASISASTCPSISGSFEIVGVFRRLQDEQSAQRDPARLPAAAGTAVTAIDMDGRSRHGSSGVKRNRCSSTPSSSVSTEPAECR